MIHLVLLVVCALLLREFFGMFVWCCVSKFIRVYMNELTYTHTYMCVYILIYKHMNMYM